MLRQKNDQVQLLVRLFDLALACVAYVAAFGVRSFLAGRFPHWGIQAESVVLDQFLWILAASVLLHLLLYPYFKFYESLRLKTIGEIISMLARAFAVELLLLASLVFFLQAKSTSRSFFVVFLILNYGLLLVSKIGIRTFLSAVRSRGYNFRQVLVIGVGKSARRVIQELGRMKHWGYVPCGVLHFPHETLAAGAAKEVEGIPILGELSELRRVVQTQTIDDVFFAGDQLDLDLMQDYARMCEELGIPIRFSVGGLELRHSRIGLLDLNGLPILTFYRSMRSPVEVLLKRAIDVVGASIGLVMTAILYPWISYRIRRESPGPVVFRQVRVGENGRRFKCYKFRTMHVGAESELAKLKEQNLMQGPMFKLENDPRVFAFGAFLRRTSLDELPQFLNVFRGDMSLVGTRPPTPDEVEQYELRYRRRLSIRPGLTGLWQVSGRNRIQNFDDVVKLDTQYIDRWSIALDLQILFKTVWVVLFRRGAY